ncbi:1625_t:CDS:2 [Racocetra fulgida]|uniref:1625_t:CDS:1 n=1 Tax=Racocetra fulgida TaxID=60492 RepID=A0A9N9EES9_9GLOM|nr:1625_t:CDS:2 [Racocetra fulgida]
MLQTNDNNPLMNDEYNVHKETQSQMNSLKNTKAYENNILQTGKKLFNNDYIEEDDDVYDYNHEDNNNYDHREDNDHDYREDDDYDYRDNNYNHREDDDYNHREDDDYNHKEDNNYDHDYREKNNYNYGVYNNSKKRDSDDNYSSDINKEYSDQNTLQDNFFISDISQKCNQKNTVNIEKNNDYCSVPSKFLERLNAQNKVFWKNQLKQDKKLDKMMKVILKLQQEDSLSSAFFEKSIIGIVTIIKEIQKISLYSTAELFKEHLEIYVERWFKGYMKDIEEQWKKNPQVSEAYNKLWEVNDNNLTTINTIIMKAMSREAKEDCLKPPIIAFALAICCTVLNPYSKDIRCTEEVQLNANQVPSKNDIMNIQDESRDESNINGYDDNDIEELSENDTNEDARLFE